MSLRLLLTGVLATACGPTLHDDSDSGAGNDAGAATGTQTSGPGATSGSTPDASDGAPGSEGPVDTGGEGCGPNPCGPCSPRCTAVDECEDDRWSCTCDCPEDDGPPPDPCPNLQEVLTDWTALSKGMTQDCGSVGLGDGDDAWLAEQGCIGNALVNDMTFFARWAGDDDPFEFAIAGREGELYETAYWEVTGFGTITQYACNGAGVLDACQVAVGEMCVLCGDPTQSTVLCDPK